MSGETALAAVPSEALRVVVRPLVRVAVRSGVQAVGPSVAEPAVSPAASGWAGQLSGLVAVMRERRLAGLRVDGDRVLLKGAVGNTADKGEIEKMIQAQLPPGFRMRLPGLLDPVQRSAKARSTTTLNLYHRRAPGPPGRVPGTTG